MTEFSEAVWQYMFGMTPISKAVWQYWDQNATLGETRMTEFNIGDVVQLNSGGPLMTVYELHPEDSYFANKVAARWLAEAWLKDSINTEQTCFGTGTILYMEPAKKHCKNCMCGSVWAMREYSVDASGIVEENPLEPPCDEDTDCL